MPRHKRLSKSDHHCGIGWWQSRSLHDRDNRRRDPGPEQHLERQRQRRAQAHFRPIDGFRQLGCSRGYHGSASRRRRDRFTQPATVQKGSVDFAWFAASEDNSETASWRDCLQKILAGDLLSPVLVGLIYRDTFPMGNPVTGEPWWNDRAVLLEQALERRYKRVVTGFAGNCAEEDTKPTGLCRHFGYHPDPSATHVWQGSPSYSSTAHRLKQDSVS